MTLPNPESSNPFPRRPRAPHGSEHQDQDGHGRDYTEFGYQELGQADALDRFLDGDLDRNSAAFRSAFVKREFRDRVAATEEMLADLRRPLRVPDLTDSILDAVDARKPFLAKQTRKFVTLGRLSAAAAVLLATGIAMLVEHARPGTLPLTSDATPIAGMVEASIRTHGEAVRAVHEHDAAPAAAEKNILRWSLSHLGAVQTFEVRSAAATWSHAEIASQPRSPWRMPDRTREPSTAFATFPVPDSPERVWYASGR